jgi:hypothetical protein
MGSSELEELRREEPNERMKGHSALSSLAFTSGRFAGRCRLHYTLIPTLCRGHSGRSAP